jgi:hypothetical protein
MNTTQLYAIECAAIDLAYAIRCQRDCEPMEEKSLLDTLEDLRDAFPTISDQIADVIETLEEVQS